MVALYDALGVNYSVTRCTEPRIARPLYAALAGATRIVNIGAGTGSYEPESVPLVAVEPSATMIAQRHTNAHPVEQASAEQLPFPDNAFSHAMTVLSMHHWTDRPRAFHEINRVTTSRFVAITWDPDSPPFWLTRDYFPEIHLKDQTNFPSMAELGEYFDDVEIQTIPIPADCRDGMLTAFWKRPAAYLQPSVRQATSPFASIERLAEGLEKLQNDLASGAWEANNKALLDKEEVDLGYRLVSATTRSV